MVVLVYADLLVRGVAVSIGTLACFLGGVGLVIRGLLGVAASMFALWRSADPAAGIRSCDSRSDGMPWL